MLAISLATVAPAYAQTTHGTTDEVVTEDQLDNTPPADYVVNTETQGDYDDERGDALFPKDHLQEVRITVDETNLNYLLQNAKDKPSVMTDTVTVGDASVSYAGLKTKGDYTLLHTYDDNPGSDRFSFSINFGKYIKKAEYGAKQNLYGVEKISFNNFFFDKSMLKEYASWLIIEAMGLPTPRFCLTKLYINDEYYGVYFMIENLEMNVLERYLDVDKKEIPGYLSKVELTQFKYEELLEDNSPLYEFDEEVYKEVEPMLPTVMEWVRKLNCLSAGTDFDGNRIDVNSQEYIDLLAQIMDVDEAVKYFAVHSFLVQTDSMFTTQKNFGLYVSEAGRAMLLPWDYDLAFGTYYPTDAESTANYDVDMMYLAGDYNGWNGSFKTSAQVYKDYPLFNVIYQNSTLMDKYHEYMADCSVVAALGGKCNATGEVYDSTYVGNMIDGLYDELYAAAEEELASHVYYVNNIKQPYAFKAGNDHIKLIVAMRAIGVYFQLKGENNFVSGNGCSLDLVGNGQPGGWYETNGIISNVLSNGIYFTGSYRDDSWSGKSPKITVRDVTETTPGYEQIQALKETGEVISYRVYNTVTPKNGYTLNVPLGSKTYAPEIYTMTEGVMNRQEVTVSDNIARATFDVPEIVIICYSFTAPEPETTETAQSDEAVTTQADAGNSETKENTTNWALIGGAAALIAVLVGGLAIGNSKKKKKSEEDN